MLKVRTVRCMSLSQMRLLMVCAGDAAGFSFFLREFSLFVRVYQYDHSVGDCCTRAHNLLNAVLMNCVHGSKSVIKHIE